MDRLIKIPVDYCSRCNNVFLNNKLKKCLFCGNKRANDNLPPRYQYRDVESLPLYRREWFEHPIDVDLYKGDFRY